MDFTISATKQTDAKKAAKKSPATATANSVPTLIPTMDTPYPFVSQFPVATENFLKTYGPHIGNSTPKTKFAPPTAQTAANIKAFLTALVAYEASPTAAGVTTLNNLLTALDMSAIRLQESPNDAVVFYPNPTANKTTPIVTGITFVWRFGAVQVPGDPTTYNNPLPQFFVYDPHPGQDGTIHVINTQFFAGAKCLVSHYFNPNVADNPNFKGNPITGANIARFADPSHSDTTAFVPFVERIYSLFPHAGSTITHGMVGSATNQIWATTNYKARFLQNGTPDFAALLAIAMGIQEAANSTPLLPLKTSATLCAPLPGYIVRNGNTAPLTSLQNPNSPWRWEKGVGDNTDSLGHMADGGGPFSISTQTDNSLLLEFSYKVRKFNAPQMGIFALAQANACKWYTQYDPTIHNPWKLAANFPDVYNNMALYPNLFDPDFIKAYKANGTNPYNTSSSTAAVADMNAALAEYDAAAPTASADNIDFDGDGDTDASDEVTTGNTAATTQSVASLTFSAGSEQATQHGQGFFAAVRKEHEQDGENTKSVEHKLSVR